MKELFDFLEENGLGGDRGLRRAESLTRETLAKLFAAYRALALKRPLMHIAELGEIDLFPDTWSEPLRVRSVLQLALYANRISLQDPLLDAEFEFQALDIRPQAVHLAPDPEVRLAAFRAEFISVLRMLNDLRPLIEAGVVHLVSSQLLGSKPGPGAMLADDLYGPTGSGAELLGTSPLSIPDAVAKYCDEKVLVRPARYGPSNKLQVVANEITDPTNLIIVGFDQDPVPKLYHLFDIVVPPEGTPEHEQRAVFMHFDPSGNQKVDPDTFRNWVAGSKQKVVVERLAGLELDLAIASAARAKFLTSLPVSRDLLSLSGKSGASASSAARALVDVELPYFDKTDAKDLVRARQNEPAFEEFRLAFDKAFKEIEGSDTEGLQARADEVARDLLRAPVAKISQEASRLQRNLFVDATLLLGSFTTAILGMDSYLASTGALILATGALQQLVIAKGKQDSIESMPSFFYWEATKRARKR